MRYVADIYLKMLRKLRSKTKTQSKCDLSAMFREMRIQSTKCDNPQQIEFIGPFDVLNGVSKLGSVYQNHVQIDVSFGVSFCVIAFIDMRYCGLFFVYFVSCDSAFIPRLTPRRACCPGRSRRHAPATGLKVPNSILSFACGINHQGSSQYWHFILESANVENQHRQNQMCVQRVCVYRKGPSWLGSSRWSKVQFG